nr:YesL family protein [Bacillus subtilis]WGD81504.1 YesL family protein [Bacillus subtilis]WGD83543.1 YesL family protein [Bacillus subtilis]WGD94165.1 YesL family protein [Bacillus subtilis]WGE02898.1 YesL family protein [Bacillus subtilis]
MLMIHGVTNGLNRFCTWVMRLAYLNVLWILFSLAGLIVFGLMPATAAMFTVAREWAKGNTDAPVFSVFFRTFKKEWRASQILGLIVVTAVLFLFADMRIAAQMDQPVLVNVFLSISLIFAFVVLYVFPVFSHFDVKIREVLSISFLIAFSRPAVTLLMAAGAVGVLCLVLFHVTFLLFFSGSLLSLILTKLSFKAFRSMDQRQEKEKAA